MFSCGGLREIPEHGNMQCAQCMADMLSRYLAKFVAELGKRIIYEAAHLVRHLFETKECVCPESGIVWCQNVNFVKSREAPH